MKHRAIQLGWKARAYGFVMGTAGLAGGGAAVFTTDNESGSVALLAAGVILSLFGVSGVLPTKLKFGDKAELEYLEQERLLGEALESAVDAVPPDSRAELVGYLTRLAPRSPTAAAPPLEALAREGSILRMLTQVTPNDAAVEIQPKTVNGRHVDARIFRAGGGSVVVEVKTLSKPLRAPEVRRFLSQLVDAAGESWGDDQVLLLTTSGLTQSGEKEVIEHGITHLQVRGPEDLPTLAETIQRLLDRQN